jgi:mRNA-degrading endonuclease YafQ of YafQ-DinJ toxin-antitoxin module
VIFSRTDTFKKSFFRLSAVDRKRIRGAMKKLAANPHAPYPKGMRVHTLKGVKGSPMKTGGPQPPVWEFHASMGLIITFQVGDDEIIFRNCGGHDSVLQNP